MTICIPSTIIWNLPDGDTTDPIDLEMAAKLAWTEYQALTGYSLAICPIEVRPCRAPVAEPVYQAYPVTGRLPFEPRLSNGAWINCGCGLGDACGGCGLSWVQLPGYVGRIDSVTIGGDEPLPKTAYRVDGASRLIRQDGQAWPGQDLSKPAGADGTWVVRYFQGDAPTELDDWAVGILAMEFLKAMKGDKKCRLPLGTESVQRNGLSITIRQGLFVDGSTGIREVDGLIAQRNPNRLTQPPRVASPDSRRGSITTWSR